MLKRILVLIVIACSHSINAQTVDEIISNYFETIGGVENISSFTGFKMSGKMNQMGMEIPIEIVQMKDGRSMLKAHFQGQIIKQNVFDGEVLWSTGFPSFKPEKSDEETTNMYKNQLSEFPDAWLNYKERGFVAELMGTETIDGTETFKLKLTKKPNIYEGKELPNVEFYYFDTENFIVLQTESEIMMGPGKGIVLQSKFSDYDLVEDSFYMPFTVEQGQKDQPGVIMTFDKIELDPEVDKSEFIFPEEVPEEN